MQRVRRLGWGWWCWLVPVACHGFSALSSSSSSSSSSPAAEVVDRYRTAHEIRSRHGHDAAVPLYNELLDGNPNDLTAATRLAAGLNTLQRQSRACRRRSCHHHQQEELKKDNNSDQIAQLQTLLNTHAYSTHAIATRILGIPSSLSTSLGEHQQQQQQQHPLSYARCPIYITPAKAGSVHQYPAFLDLCRPLDCLVTLFLLGLCIARSTLEGALSPSQVHLLESLALIFPCEHNPNYLIPFVSIYPMDITTLRHNNNNNNAKNTSTTTLFLATDWHPNVLATISVGTDPSEEAVMYIGPDSLALVQHWTLQPSFLHGTTTTSTTPNGKTNLRHSPSPAPWLLDLCAGSGVQALVALATHPSLTAVVCVDLNRRALRFTAFNAQLNNHLLVRNHDDHDHDNGRGDVVVHLIHGDVVQGLGQTYHYVEDDAIILNDPDTPTTGRPTEDPLQPRPLEQLLTELLPTTVTGYEWITANPPFLPVPEGIDPCKHGMFSNGGRSGERVLAAVLGLASHLLKPGGFLAMVSEFFFRSTDVSTSTVTTTGPVSSSVSHQDTLVHRLQEYWGPICDARALLLTNQFPISAQTYAARRAGFACTRSDDVATADEQQRALWESHLVQEQAILSCSPGLLYIQKPTSSPSCWTHTIVPKSSWGSLWTPSNPVATQYTQMVVQDYFRELLVLSA